MRNSYFIREATGLKRTEVCFRLATKNVRLDVNQLRRWELGESGMGDALKVALRDLYSDLLSRQITIDQLIEEVQEVEA
jgi:hypothetical protein